MDLQKTTVDIVLETKNHIHYCIRIPWTCRKWTEGERVSFLGVFWREPLGFKLVMVLPPHCRVMVKTVDTDHDIGLGRDLEVLHFDGSLDFPHDPRNRGVEAHSFFDALCQVLQSTQVLPRNGS